MVQRIITGIGLIAILMVLMYFGGAVFGAAAFLCICVAVYEEYQALRQAKYHPVMWPTWIGLVSGTILVLTFGSMLIVPILSIISLLTILCVVFRPEPKLDDIMVSILPVLSIVLPGLCIIALGAIQPKEVQVVMVSLVFSVPVVCDTLAFFVGSKVGGPKLCPHVSPNKTISGAIGGMLGAFLASLCVMIIANSCCSPEAIALLPKWWHFLLIGLLGGVVAQAGDLFASLVKRNCGIKDFSNLFPGHGGMLDRFDSILFVAVFIFGVRILIS